MCSGAEPCTEGLNNSGGHTASEAAVLIGELKPTFTCYGLYPLARPLRLRLVRIRSVVSALKHSGHRFLGFRSRLAHGETWSLDECLGLKSAANPESFDLQLRPVV